MYFSVCGMALFDKIRSGSSKRRPQNRYLSGPVSRVDHDRLLDEVRRQAIRTTIFWTVLIVLGLYLSCSYLPVRQGLCFVLCSKRT